jgi:thiamine biosynthesis protein ThiS
MKLSINGEVAEYYVGTVKDLLEELKIIPARVAVEVNLTIVKRNDYPSYVLREGDRVEIVNLVGGG